MLGQLVVSQLRRPFAAFASAGRSAPSSAPMASVRTLPAHRALARFYLDMADRHRERRDDPRLIAALVRAAWRAHEKADAALDAEPEVGSA